MEVFCDNAVLKIFKIQVDFQNRGTVYLTRSSTVSEWKMNWLFAMSPARGWACNHLLTWPWIKPSSEQNLLQRPISRIRKDVLVLGSKCFGLPFLLELNFLSKRLAILLSVLSNYPIGRMNKRLLPLWSFGDFEYSQYRWRISGGQISRGCFLWSTNTNLRAPPPAAEAKQEPHWFWNLGCF